MPFVEWPKEEGFVTALGATPPPEKPRTSSWDVAKSAFRHDNDIVNVFRQGLAEHFPEDPNHNPMDVIRNTDYFRRHSDRFVGSRSEAETRSIMQRIDEEEADNRILDAAGAEGFLLQALAGTTTPTILLPAGAIYRSGRAGLSLLKTGASFAAGAAGQAAIQEYTLQQTQLTRTFGESAAVIGSASILGGLLGAGAWKLMSAAERRAMSRTLAAERADMDLHLEPELPPAPAGAQPSSTTAEMLAKREGYTRNLDDVLTAAASPGNAKVFVDIGPVAHPERIREVTGLDVDMSRFRHTIDNYAVRHALEQHSDEAAEAARGQIQITPDDIRRAPEIIDNPDNITYGEKNDLGRDLVIYEKKIGDQFFYVEEVRTGRYEMAMQTMYKRKDRGGAAPRPDAAQGPSELTSVADGADTEGSIAGGPGGFNHAGAGATDTRKLEQLSFGFDKVPGWSRIARFIGTDLGIYASKSLVGRRMASELFETTLRFKQNVEGQVTSPVVPLDREVKIYTETARIEVADELKRLYSEYFFGAPDAKFPYARAEFQTRFGGETVKLSPDDFDKEVASAMQTGDRHAIPQVEMAAQFIRRKILDPWAKRMEAANPDFKMRENKPGESFFPYRWDNAKIEANRPEFVETVVFPKLKSDQTIKAAAQERLQILSDQLAKSTGEEAAAIRAKIEAELVAWEGKSVSEVKSALRAREKYAKTSGRADDAAERLRAADRAVDDAVQSILKSDRHLDDIELRDKAEEITDHVLGTPIGRIPYDIAAQANKVPRSPIRQERGSLIARDFDIPYALAKDWISHDLNHVLGAWMRTMVPDTLLFERFPGEGPALTSRYRAIQEEYAGLVREAKTAKERTALNREKDNLIATIAGVLDRVRGVTDTTAGLSGRVGQAAKRINQILDLGFAAITSIPDFSGPVFVAGLERAFKDGWAPYLRYLSGNPELVRMSKTELRALGVAAEVENATRGHALAEISEVYHPRSRLERVLKAVSDKFFLVNMQAQQTNMAKRMAGRVIAANILHAVEAEATGKATQRMIADLRASNIDQNLARRIWDQFNGADGGAIIDGTYHPNTANWTDERAKMHFIAALSRDVERAVVTPGSEKPLWISTNAGGLLGQFKTFSLAATNKIMIANLQVHDARSLQGVVVAIGLGVLSYKINTLIRGEAGPDRPQDWIKEGISRSGLLGIIEDVNMFSSKATRGTVDIYRLIGADKPLSRNVNRTILSSVLGPTAGKIENIAKITGALGTADWSESDTRAVRRLIALQNVFYLNRAFDEVERGFNGAFGIEMKAR